ncbi:MAG: hypothetical protein A2566_02445 [Candidatus Zambryskibacteria bacterium RIFOXYD1_FULL_40_13]|nr:MAG: hypothetical protein UT25_C0001G0229 [Parcubacteria group bacterium GW2011_GWC1_39_12]KKR19753.1 MAG: hypothetical protein UT49_C0001G0229 [Parcubacteria group bacterium GW2011_GWF1_39_37]KKR35909.1 MAG: hypothetical protein UT68_C0001G0232 [Parcubacteria group bacterium GW2011_GWC2_40_10]KKR52721.1 MAG: hypothetical protein UT89_C0001G0229 [Parcubacteria group bacterium GW2011_GWE1_40_20]KKR65943.1 MAG: hypothetical protein UU06_C0008G0009 [Parcubacteria group bacterium GW2011_GWB1_40_
MQQYSTTKKMLGAAEIIEMSGVGGLTQASELVGKKTAIAMLILQLRHNLGPGSTPNSSDDADSRILKVLDQEGLG